MGGCWRGRRGARGSLAALAVTGWLAAGPGAAAGAETGPSFDCRAAGTAVERLICSPGAGLGELAGLDVRMAALYRAALARAPAPDDGKGGLKAQQRRFLADRNACAADERGGPAGGEVILSCVRQLMLARVAELARAVGDNPAGGWFDDACEAWHGLEGEDRLRLAWSPEPEPEVPHRLTYESDASSAADDGFAFEVDGRTFPAGREPIGRGTRVTSGDEATPAGVMPSGSAPAGGALADAMAAGRLLRVLRNGKAIYRAELAGLPRSHPARFACGRSEVPEAERAVEATRLAAFLARRLEERFADLEVARLTDFPAECRERPRVVNSLKASVLFGLYTDLAKYMMEGKGLAAFLPSARPTGKDAVWLRPHASMKLRQLLTGLDLVARVREEAKLDHGAVDAYHDVLLAGIDDLLAYRALVAALPAAAYDDYLHRLASGAADQKALTLLEAGPGAAVLPADWACHKVYYVFEDMTLGGQKTWFAGMTLAEYYASFWIRRNADGLAPLVETALRAARTAIGGP